MIKSKQINRPVMTTENQMCYEKAQLRSAFIVSNLNDILMKISDRLFWIVSYKMQRVEQGWIASVSRGGKGGLMGVRNLSQINEVEMVRQCVIGESDKPVPPMKQLSWH